MNLEQLKVFYMAATKKNFSETAKVLHLSQPSVSLQIKNLEAYLNTPLFIRTTKKIELTDTGEVLFHYAEKILHLVNKAEKEITLLSDSIHGDLKIGASLTIGEHLLPFYLGKFKQEFPKVNIIMKIYNSHQIIEKLINEEIDLGFIEASIPHKKIFTQSFLEDELVIIASRNNPHPLIENRHSLTPMELFEIPIIMREQGSGTRQVIEENLIKNNLDPNKLNVILELENTESIKSAVESGMGISIISKTAVKKELKLGTLRKINIESISLTRYFYMVHRSQQILTPACDSFHDFILNYFSQENKNGEDLVAEGTAYRKN